MSLTARINCAKGDVGVTKATSLVTCPKFQIKRSCIGRHREDAGRLCGFVGIGRICSGDQNEPEPCKEPTI